MSNINKINVNGTDYDIEDSTARSSSTLKLDKQQGTENVGKAMVVQANGELAPETITPTGSVTFADIEGQPTDNTNLAAALNDKVAVTQGTEKAGQLLKVGTDGKVVTGAMPTSAEWGKITGVLSAQGDLSTVLADKVDKVSGKGLSTNDYTTDEKNKLAGIEEGAQVNKINKILDSTGAEISITGGSLTINKTVVGLSNVDNTSDANKPISTAMQSALDNKVTAEAGKGLSTNDFTNAQKTAVETVKTALDAGKVLSTNDYSNTDKEALTKIETQLASNPEGKLSDENFSTTLKTKLDSIPSTAQENVIETVKVNGTALTPSAKAVDVTVPTKVSDLTNDSNFQTTSDVSGAIGTHNTASDAHSDLFAGKLSIEGSYTAGQIAKVDTDGKLKVMDASTATVGWNDVTSKPFKTVSTGLDTASDALSVKYGTVAGTACQGNDTRLSDARTPTAHASSHVDGTDDIQTADSSKKGLLSSTDWNTFNGKQDALTFDDAPTASSNNPVKSSGIYTALSGKEPTIATKNTAFNKNFGADTTKIKADGTAAVGTEDTVARIDHVHPTDTTRAAASDLTTHTSNTANPHSVTATQIGVEEGAEVNKIKADGTAAVGTEDTVARIDHVHPTDTTRAAASDLTTHTSNTANPHSVTATQIGVEEGAEVNKIETIKVNGTAQTITSKAVDITVPTKVSTLTNDSNFQTGDNVSSSISAHNSATTAHSDIRGLITTETSARTSADANLQTQIDALEAKALVKDIVGTHADLLTYDVTKLTTNDRIQVLQDETHSNANSYYKYNGGAQTACWTFIGSTAETYTKTETDSTFVKQTRTVNGKALSADVTLALSDLGDDTTHRLVTDAEKSTWNSKVDAVSGKGLSTKDYTADDQSKLSGIATGAQVNVLEAVKDSSGAALTITDKAVTLSKAAVGLGNVDNTADTDKTFAATQITSGTIDIGRIPVGTTSGTVCAGDDPRLESSAPTAHASTHLTGGTDAIQLASGTQNGLLSSTDWNTFNGKQDALTFDDAPTASSTNPVKSSGIYTALNGKVDAVSGKGLSTNDFTDDLKTKLDGIEAGAEKNVQADWSQTDTEADDYIKAKPTVPTQLAQLLTDTSNQRYSETEKTKLSGIESGAQVNKIEVIKDNNGTSLTITDKAVQITKAAVGLGNVDNTSDANKPISSAVQAALNLKLESSDLTAHTSNTTNPHSVTKAQVGLGSVEDGAQINKIETIKLNGVAQTITDKTVALVTPSTLSSFTDDATHRLVTDTEKSAWNGKQNALTFDNTPTEGGTNPVYSGGIYTALAGKEPTITKATAFNKNFGNAAGTVCEGNDSRLTNARAPTTHAASHGDGGTDELVLDASQVTTGVFDAARIPSAAFQTLVTVANATARLALTSAEVNTGDSVYQTDNTSLYMVKDDTKLGTEDAFLIYTSYVNWNTISGKPVMPTQASGTLLASGWVSKSQTISITGMTSTCAAIVTPAPTSMSDYTDAGIVCMTQASGQLTFTCDEVPTTDLTVNIVMIFT